MENTTKSNANRGVRKPVTLLVMGDESAIIHPLYLHINKAGFMHGIAIDRSHTATHFVLSMSEFHKTTLNVVKGYS